MSQLSITFVKARPAGTLALVRNLDRTFTLAQESLSFKGQVTTMLPHDYLTPFTLPIQVTVDMHIYVAMQ